MTSTNEDGGGIDAIGPAASGAVERQLEWTHRRIQQLADEVKRGEARNRENREQRQRAEQERERVVRMLARAESLVRSMELGLQGMRGSTALQLGYLLTQATRSMGDMWRLPQQAFKLLRRARSPGRSQDVVSVPLPQEWYSASLRRELSEFYSELSPEELAGESVKKVSTPAMILLGSESTARLPSALSEIRIASVMDEFTFTAYRDCCEVTQVTPEGWFQEIEAIRPHLLFIESAWDGKDGKWQRKVSQHSQELRELAGHCRKNKIPVVFWSKEDPVHFKVFLTTARLADVVFTTDIDCVKHYKSELGHERVYLLPFATQPRSHNPIERFERKSGFCFAGSYYLRYPIRQRDFAALIAGASRLGNVDIYDRNFGKDHPNYTFPEEYKSYILGNLSFDQIDLAYRGYEFGININTVKHSQSMFARRVFDLLGSNTTTVSNYSRGLRLMFGDLVVSSDNADQLVRTLSPLVHDDLLRRKHRLAGLRKVMGEHTYQHRLAYMLEKTHGQALRAPEPEVMVLARARSQQEMDHLLAAFHRQNWSRKKLLLCFEQDFRPAVSPVGPDTLVLSSVQAAARLVSRVDVDGYVAGFHVDDYYGPNYLTDLALATSYSPAPAIGKAAHYVLRDGIPVLVGDGSQYRPGGAVAKRRGMILATEAGSVPIAEWLDGLATENLPTDVLALDEFNYCQGGAVLATCEQVDDLVGLDTGVSMAELFRIAERIPENCLGDASGARDESVGIPGLEAAELHRLLGNPGSGNISYELDDSLIITSTVPAGKYVYSYLAASFTPAELQFSDIAKLQLVCDHGEGLELVLVYKDAAGQKISHSILKSALNLTVTVPTGTCAVEVGFKVSRSGQFRIRRVVFDHVSLPVEAMVTRGKHLLLAKNYPSYGDLYKHAFVHRRVLEYRRQGVDVDVFRIGANGLSFYEFDGVDVAYGQADHLRAMLKSGNYESVLVHFLDERMWQVLQEFVERIRVFVWAHGAEIQSASRRAFDHVDEATRARAMALGDRRMKFWRGIFSDLHPNFSMVFVSEWFAQDVMDDVGIALPADAYRVIHNFIDTDFFAYHPKPKEQRSKILSIRPFESAKYANDLSVSAVLALRDKPFFNQLSFHFVGDGRLFDEVMAPLSELPNVTIERRFLGQAEIAELHRENGIFLNPTRMDAQGVSRDESMASGLVPITTRCTAIPEFVDASCGVLAEPEDAQALADAIERLYRNPEQFLAMSESAAKRVREQSGFGATIAKEIRMFDGLARNANRYDG